MGISPLPRRVQFGDYIGEVLDEVWVQEDFEDTDYRFFIQQIRWFDGSETIRFAYYTRPHGSNENAWNYANRPPNIGENSLRRLLQLARDRPWFRGIIE